MRPELLNPLFRDISSLPGVGEKTAQWMRLLCGHRVLDLLFHLPIGVRYRPVYAKEKPFLGQLATFPFIAKRYMVSSFKKSPFRVVGQAPFGRVELVFFRVCQGQIEAQLPLDQKRWISGILQEHKGILSLVHPDYIREKQEDIPVYEAVYPLTTGARASLLAKVLHRALTGCPDLPEWQAESTVISHHWGGFKESLCQVHHPSMESEELWKMPAYERLAYDELLANQLCLLIARQKNRSRSGQAFPATQVFQLDLPFSLTRAQQKVLSEIATDLASPVPMCRLLQGDVGSGKTIVAVLSALQVIGHHAQVVLMAPTDILARQHAQKITTLLSSLPIQVALLTGREKGKKRQEILNALSLGKISLLIGTHALIEENVCFKNLGLVIIDEQHRFGVDQRLKLTQKQKGVHLLLMTATPIPRSLAMTAYGDMDISILDEKPPGRQPVTTRMMSDQKIPEIIQKLKWWPNQVYWVCPLVAESEKTDLMAATVRFNELQQVFGSQVGLLHGQMKAEEKEKVMADFVAGKIKILVSTTVIEVGVDVPSASLMVVEHAERFGLATLHQLRGRIGRGPLTSICLLIYGHLSSNARQRLELLRDTEDGFQIAEADLRMRGAGEILGWRQSGLPDFQVAHLPEQVDLLRQAIDEAKAFLAGDPTLSTKRGQALRLLLYLFNKEAAILTLKAG